MQQSPGMAAFARVAGQTAPQGQPRLTPSEMAALGRGGDTLVAHLTPGELTVPPQLQSPQLIAALQAAAGRVELLAPAEQYIPDKIREHGFEALPVALAHALRAGDLPRIHGDPFDRMLVAQGQVEDVPIVTGDPLVGRYDVETIW